MKLIITLFHKLKEGKINKKNFNPPPALFLEKLFNKPP